ncbi:MAG: hypothetical protein AAF596_10105, partial [Planctomycetota bacterium]
MARKEAGNSGVATADTGRHRRGNSTSGKSARRSAPATRKWLLIGITAGVLAVAAAGKWLAGTPTAQAQAPPTEVAAAG